MQPKVKEAEEWKQQSCMPGLLFRPYRRRWSLVPVCWTSWKKHWRPFLLPLWKGITPVCITRSWSQCPTATFFVLVFRTKCLCRLLSIGFPRGRHGSVWCRTAGGVHHFAGVLLNISLLLLSCGCGRLRQSSGIHNSCIFKPRGCNGWIVLLKPAKLGQVSDSSVFFPLSPLRSASAACRCPGWSVCSSFPLWTWSSLLTAENGRTPQEPTHLMGLTQHLPLHQGSTFPKHCPLKVCKIAPLMRKC